MIRHALARLARMDAAEVGWRGRSAARALLDRARTRVVAPRWARADLLGRMAPLRALSAIREALAARQWHDAQRELARHFNRTPRRFAIAAQSRLAVTERIRRDYPGAAAEAARRADRIVGGDYDLLGYRGLRFDQSGDPPLAAPDWSLDSVNDRRPPREFWSTIPFLDPACGDHKIIWELNRHQHWLVLGRAFWLTGDRRYRDRFLAELASWMGANPPLMGINWASMLEIAFRSIAWLWAIQMFVEDGPGREYDQEPAWLVDLLVGIDRQLAHVERNLSIYFSPNTHLLGEALALYVTGRALPELAASPRRASTGRALLIQGIDRQIAADGGHCERSTHYHRYTLEFYSLALIVARQTGDDQAVARFEDAVARTAAAARLLADDSGRVPHIGDDDGGALTPIIERDPDDLRGSLAVAATLVNRPEFQVGDTPEDAVWLLGPDIPILSPEIRLLPSGALDETGYYVSRSAGSHLVIDGGPHGYQNGGHAHADALSLTLGVRGVPLLIDPGTACYTSDAMLRDRMRSTALHNTVVVDGRSQSVPNGPFHWSQVANGRVHRWEVHDAFDYFDASHDGYHPAEHRRRLLVLHGDLIVVADHVGGPGGHTAAVHWHLDPRWSAEIRSRGAIFTRAADGADRVGLSVPEGVVDLFIADAATGLGWCSPAYGRVDRTATVRIAHEGQAPFWIVSVFDLDPQNAVSHVDWMPVWTEAGSLAQAAAIRISRATSVDHVLFAAPREDTAENATAARDASWRVGEVETNARMLFYRATLDQPFARLALVDGSLARAAGRRGFEIALQTTTPAFVSDSPFDHRRTTSDEPRTTKDHHPCAASPVS